MDLLPYREAALLTAFFTGSTASLDADLRSWLTGSGAAYLVGMYGYKIHLLWSAAVSLAGRFVPRYVAIAAAVAAVAVFVAIAGAPVSAIRAGIMVGIASFAELTGRPFARGNALAATAIVMAAFRPAIVETGSFILSFASLAGIYVLSPRIANMLPGKWKDYFGWKFHLSAAVGVNLAIMPLVAIMDGDFPLIAFFSNIFMAIPLGGILMLGAAASAARQVLPGFAAILAVPLAAMLSYEISMAKVFSMVSATVQGGIFTPLIIFLYYGALAVWIVAQKNEKRY